MQSTDYRGELPILASPRRAMERRPCGPRPSTPASAGRPTAAIHTDPRSKDKSWADGIGQPGKLGGRVRSLAYLRLTAAGASALGAARRRRLAYLRLTAAGVSALGAARRRRLAYLRLTAAGVSALGAARRRRLAYLRLAAAVASALGAARRRRLAYLRLAAAVASALGAARRRSCPPRSGLRPLLRLYFAAPAAHRHGTAFTRHEPTSPGGSGRWGALRSVIKAEAEGHATFAEQRSTKLNL